MLRHSRAHTRYQRQRMIARRRRQFANWLGGVDYGPIDEHGHRISWSKTPRPREIREAEFWSGWRLGRFAKWNGTCSCGICRENKTMQKTKKLRKQRYPVDYEAA